MAKDNSSLDILNAYKKREEERKEALTCPKCGKELSFLGVPGLKGRFYTHPQSNRCKARYRTIEDIKEDEKELEDSNRQEINENKKINKEKAEPKDAKLNEDIKPRDSATSKVEAARRETQYKQGIISMTITRKQYEEIKGDTLNQRELIREVNRVLNNVDLHAFDFATPKKSLMPRLTSQKLSRFKERITKERITEETGGDDLEKKMMVRNGVLTRIDGVNKDMKEQANVEERMDFTPALAPKIMPQVEENDIEKSIIDSESISQVEDTGDAALESEMNGDAPDEMNANFKSTLEEENTTPETEEVYFILPGREFPLESKMLISRVTIGRSNSQDITICNKTVSSLHAVIVKRGDNYYMKDLSTNGTYFVRGGKKLRLPKGMEVLLNDTEDILISNIPAKFLANSGPDKVELVRHEER